jgi:hypothetical protein
MIMLKESGSSSGPSDEVVTLTVRIARVTFIDRDGKLRIEDFECRTDMDAGAVREAIEKWFPGSVSISISFMWGIP